ncbi:GNAT family N-acetyltransferase [Sodalis sp. dw_96]|uniref:GNAT family N-acetyltransferase n=1 Tax=Sodalis sp. dw_96 TaxID=2719794 RepID=UPI001BD1CE5B|nr:GNAT family N-acetyltransferase [Sodalis sp. dw_96]
MELILSNVADESEEKLILNALRRHNGLFSPVDVQPLRITMKDPTGMMKGGLIAKTWWGGLDIIYLWVADEYRKKGYGRNLMMMAENEALIRGCHFAYLQTLSIQAPDLYKKLGYVEYGSLGGFAHQFSRHYLCKFFDKKSP